MAKHTQLLLRGLVSAHAGKGQGFHDIKNAGGQWVDWEVASDDDVPGAAGMGG